MKHTKKVTTTRTYRTCDFCMKEKGRIKICVGCGGDVCESCGVWWDKDPWTGDNNGDYPEMACKSCDKKVKYFEEKAIDVRTEEDAKVDKLREEWLVVCKGAGNGNQDNDNDD